MVFLTWILGLLFMVIALLSGVTFLYASSVSGVSMFGIFGNNILSVLIVVMFSIVMPFLLGVFFMLLPSYVRKHARAINTEAFD